MFLSGPTWLGVVQLGLMSQLVLFVMFPLDLPVVSVNGFVRLIVQGCVC